MSRFDLYKERDGADYMLDVQCDFLSALDSRLVIPVVAQEKISVVHPRIHVMLTIHDKPHYAITNMMGAVSARQLGRPVASAAPQGDEIVAAIDFLLQGF